MRYPNKILLLVLILINTLANAQNQKIVFKGQLNVTGDFYSLQADSIGSTKPRRPDFLGRITFNASVNYKSFSLPITVMFFNGQYSTILPSYPTRNLLGYIQDPANRIGIAPKYKWVEILLGTHVPQYSELTVGDLPQFGAGINLTPGKFKFSFFSGKTQLGIQADSVNNIKGIFARKMYSAKIGFGNEEESHIYFIGSMLKDDTNSIKKQDITMPQNGINAATDFRIKFSKQVYFKAEAAVSAFTRNTYSPALTNFESDIKISDALFKTKESSRMDFASTAILAKDGKKFGLKLSGKYIGDGFVAVGYPFLQTDRFDVLVEPKFSILKNKLQVNGSVGKRVNNLSQGRSSIATQNLGSANISADITDNFNVAFSYSNFGFKNNITNDTLRISLSTVSWSICPTYTLLRPKNTQVFTISYNKDAFRDFNTISGATNDNDVNFAMVMYMVAFNKKPLTISVSANVFENKLNIGILNTRSGNIGFGYQFLNKKLLTNIGFTYTENFFSQNDPSKQLFTNLGVTYKLHKSLTLLVQGSINNYKYGTEKPNISFRENILRTALTYNF